MATLQSIRNRGSLIVTVFIGLALVAFIVGDALSSGSSWFNSSKNAVGVVAGEKITGIDYHNKLTENEEMLKGMNGLAALTEEQQVALRENTWRQMVMNIVMGREFKELGLDVGKEELYDLLLGSDVSPIIRQLFANPNTGELNHEEMQRMVKFLVDAPADTPQKALWLNIEKQVREARKEQKYQNLILKSMFTPDSMLEDKIRNTANLADISYTVKYYSSVSDSVIDVSDIEIKNYYNEHLPLFQQGESRRIAYVNFEVKASDEDIEETRKWVEELSVDFENAEDLQDFVNLSSDEKFENYYYARTEIEDEELANFAFSGNNAVYGPYRNDGFFMISRVADVKYLADSVRVRHILLNGNGSNPKDLMHLADSLAKAIRRGADFEKLARENSVDHNTAVNGGDLGWLSQKMMNSVLRDSLFFAKKGDVRVIPTQAGIELLQITGFTKPLKKVRLATVKKEIFPSQKTINLVYNEARMFVTGIQGIKDFDDKIEASNLTKRIANIDKNDRTISGLQNARDLVRHVYLTDKTNTVVKTSDDNMIFDGGNIFTVAVLTDINEEGTAPLQTVGIQIKNELIRKKKARILEKEIRDAVSGSESLLSVASKLGAEVKEVRGLNFSGFQFGGEGIEPVVISSAMNLPDGVISEPIIGNRGVYLLMVDNRETGENTAEIRDNVKNYVERMKYTAVLQMQGPIEALIKNAKVEDRRYKFY